MGDEKEFKGSTNGSRAYATAGCGKSKGQFVHSLKQVKHLYLWTERGALLHAKSLNTDKAWEVYDYLVEFYFRATEKKEKPKPKPPLKQVVDVPENPAILKAIEKLRSDLTCMDVLLEDCIRYSEEEVYLARRKAASEVIHILISDVSRFLDLKPKLIEKMY